MGYSVSREAHGLANHLYSGGSWRVVSVEEHKNIVRSSQGIEADEYTVNINHDYSVKDELEIYAYRKTQDLPLVRIIAVDVREAPPSGGFCTGGTLNLSAIVLTERIQQTLAVAPQISFPEAMYVLSEAIVGFKELYSKVGPFEITDRMIGFTPHGFVKVWMNENFALNHPSIESISPLQTTNYLPGDNLTRRTEVGMVKNLIKVVQYHTENGSFPNRWELEELSQPYMTFQDCHKLIQTYVRAEGIFVPDRISDGRILRITKTKVRSGMASSNTVVETVETRQIQQPTLVETTTTTTNVPIPTQVNTVTVGGGQQFLGASYREPMLRQPNNIVYNVRPTQVMTVGGGSRVIAPQFSPTKIAGPNLVIGQPPVLVGGSRISSHNTTPLNASPVRVGSPAMPSPPMSHPSQQRVIQSFVPPPPPSFVTPQVTGFQLNPAPTNQVEQIETIQEVFEVPSQNGSVIKTAQIVTTTTNQQPTFQQQSIDHLPVMSIDQAPPPPQFNFDAPPAFNNQNNFGGMNWGDDFHQPPSAGVIPPPAFNFGGSNLYQQHSSADLIPLPSSKIYQPNPAEVIPLPAFNFGGSNLYNQASAGTIPAPSYNFGGSNQPPPVPQFIPAPSGSKIFGHTHNSGLRQESVMVSKLSSDYSSELRTPF